MQGAKLFSHRKLCVTRKELPLVPEQEEKQRALESSPLMACFVAGQLFCLWLSFLGEWSGQFPPSSLLGSLQVAGFDPMKLSSAIQCNFLVFLMAISNSIWMCCYLELTQGHLNPTFWGNSLALFSGSNQNPLTSPQHLLPCYWGNRVSLLLQQEQRLRHLCCSPNPASAALGMVPPSSCLHPADASWKALLERIPSPLLELCGSTSPLGSKGTFSALIRTEVK